MLQGQEIKNKLIELVEDGDYTDNRTLENATEICWFDEKLVRDNDIPGNAAILFIFPNGETAFNTFENRELIASVFHKFLKL